MAGVNFSQLAKEFSEDLATKNDGGKFRLYRSVADPKIAERVFSMRINVPELVESETGFHIIRVMKLEPAGAKKSAKCAPRFGNICTKRSLTKSCRLRETPAGAGRVKTFLNSH